MTNPNTIPEAAFGSAAWVQCHFPLESCPHCGYSFTGRTGHGPCPECGIVPSPDEVVLYGWNADDWMREFTNTRWSNRLFQAIVYALWQVGVYAFLLMGCLIGFMIVGAVITALLPLTRMGLSPDLGLALLILLIILAPVMLCWGCAPLIWKVLYDAYCLYRRLTDSPWSPRPVQVRLGPSGLATRNGFGPVRRRQGWNAVVHPVRLIARRGYYRLHITRAHWIPRWLGYPFLNIELVLEPEAGERLRALLTYFQVRQKDSRRGPTAAPTAQDAHAVPQNVPPVR